jgi:phosphate acetyltransferase
MSNLFEQIEAKVKKEFPTLVFPEGTDERILEAAIKLGDNKVLHPIVVGNLEIIQALATKLGKTLTNVEVQDPNNYPDFDELVAAFVERRKGKATEEQARKQLLDVNYFGVMLVYSGKAKGLVSGAAHSTGDTVRPALQIIKMKPGFNKTSGVFVMVKGDEKLIFGDCAINMMPSSADLAETAVAAANTARVFDMDPKVAMLSFSTNGSAVSPETEKVVEATRLAKEMDPELVIDGEFQFDAAFVPSVAAKKAPNSPLKGEANVFIFPTLDAGNIGYKLVQRLGGYEAVGPILQGLNKPVNDLSRGCSSDDAYKLALITAMQE